MECFLNLSMLVASISVCINCVTLLPSMYICVIATVILTFCLVFGVFQQFVISWTFDYRLPIDQDLWNILLKSLSFSHYLSTCQNVFEASFYIFTHPSRSYITGVHV